MSKICTYQQILGLQGEGVQDQWLQRVTFGGDIIFEWPPRNTLSIKTRFQIEFNIDFDLRIDIRNSRSYDSDRRA